MHTRSFALSLARSSGIRRLPNRNYPTRLSYTPHTIIMTPYSHVNTHYLRLPIHLSLSFYKNATGCLHPFEYLSVASEFTSFGSAQLKRIRETLVSQWTNYSLLATCHVQNICPPKISGPTRRGGRLSPLPNQMDGSSATG